MKQTEIMEYKGYIIKKSRFGGYWVFKNKTDADKVQYTLFGGTLERCKQHIESNKKKERDGI